MPNSARPARGVCASFTQRDIREQSAQHYAAPRSQATIVWQLDNTTSAMRIALLSAIALVVMFSVQAACEFRHAPSMIVRMHAIHRRRLIESPLSLNQINAAGTSKSPSSSASSESDSQTTAVSSTSPAAAISSHSSSIYSQTSGAESSTESHTETNSVRGRTTTKSSAMRKYASQTSIASDSGSSSDSQSNTQTENQTSSTQQSVPPTHAPSKAASSNASRTGSESKPTSDAVVTAVRSRHITVVGTLTNSDNNNAVVTVSSQVDSPRPTGQGGIEDSSSEAGGNKNIAVIAGTSVAGGVVFIILLAFILYKLCGKRVRRMFSSREIMWPELNRDTAIAPTAPLPARQTGGAGIDMGDEDSEDEDLLSEPHIMQESTLKPAGSGAFVPYTETNPYGIQAIPVSYSYADYVPTATLAASTPIPPTQTMPSGESIPTVPVIPMATSTTPLLGGTYGNVSHQSATSNNDPQRQT